MKLINSQFKINIDDQSRVRELFCSKYKIEDKDLISFIIAKVSIDARRTPVSLIYSIIFEISDYKRVIQYKNVEEYTSKTVELKYPKYKFNDRPIVVGFGPSGMFSALYLARAGACPIIIERGSRVEDRITEVKDFQKNKVLNEDSNVQFGEGGAGTFSDGKLTSNVKDPLINFILNEFVAHGSPKEILYESKPHIGTDYLSKTVKNIREEIISLGGEFFFNTKFESLEQNGEKLTVKCGDKEFSTSHLLLGIGHSARDTFRMLHALGVNMEAKPFSMGVRIEHRRVLINRAQYGDYADKLPAADYKMSAHLDNGRSVYTFCMCPGGVVMPSATEKNTIVTNGMSLRDRNERNSNSAILCNIETRDFYENSPLDGLDYQEKYEKAAFDISGDYKAPANLVREFLNGRIAKEERLVKTSYVHGLYMTDLNNCLPPFVVKSIKKGIRLFDRKIYGFADPDAIVIGVETRSSSPVRIIRDAEREASISGVYPIGEGPGYAGGITSSSLDGLKTAMSICGEVIE